MPSKRRLAFAVTALALLAACGRGLETAPSAPAAEAAPAGSAAPPAAPPPPAEAVVPAPAPAAAPYDEKADDKRREDALQAPAKRDELGEAVAELERARTELDSALAPRAARPAATAGAGASRSADAAPKAEKKSSESSCSTACRAFTSLGRAAGAVCRLAGEKDARCTHAHEVLADAQKRVTVCGCQAG